MRYVILGATKGMGRALARVLAERGDALFLLGRSEAELARSAQDLVARGAASVGHALCDLESPDSFAPALDAAFDTGPVGGVIVTAALFAPQLELEEDEDLADKLLTVNFGHTVSFCERARKRLLAAGGGKLCVFSSVAGERGRKPVILYGASKAGLSAYLEGLDHKFRAEGLEVITVKPGFVRTGMTAGLPEPPFAGDPEAVAATVARALDRGTPVVYAPAPWALVMGVIRRLPRFVMRRVGF